MKNFFTAIALVLSLATFSIIALPAQADETPKENPSVDVGNPLSQSFNTSGTVTDPRGTAVEVVQSRLATLLSTMLRGIAALSLLPIVVGGFQMVISQGNEDKVSRGKQTVYFGVVGLFLALIAIAFFQTMLSFLNFSS